MASIPASTAAPQYEFRTILRHRWPLRAMHWINLLCMLALVNPAERFVDLKHKRVGCLLIRQFFPVDDAVNVIDRRVVR